MFIKCKHHGRVQAKVTKDFRVYCPLCKFEELDFLLRDLPKEELQETIKEILFND